MREMLNGEKSYPQVGEFLIEKKRQKGFTRPMPHSPPQLFRFVLSREVEEESLLYFLPPLPDADGGRGE
jgi:hypothetical protein